MIESPFSLEVIQVATPCTQSWEAMQGDDRVRHCDACDLNVYNLSEMSRGEAEQLVLALEQVGWVGHDPLVELVIACDEHGQRLVLAASGPSDLLPHGCHGAREAVEHAGVEAADVDAELERRGRDDPPERAVEQLVFDLASLLGEVAGAVCHTRSESEPGSRPAMSAVTSSVPFRLRQNTIVR